MTLAQTSHFNCLNPLTKKIILNSYFIANHKTLLGYCYIAMDEQKGYDLLENSISDCWEMIEKGLLSPEIIKAYIYAGEAQRYRKNLMRANYLLEVGNRRIIEMFDEKPDHPLHAKNLAQMGLLQISQKEYECAENTLNQAQDMMKSIFKEETKNPTMVWIHQGKAEIALYRKKIEVAKAEIEIALNTANQVFPEKSKFLYGHIQKIILDLDQIKKSN